VGYEANDEAKITNGQIASRDFNAFPRKNGIDKVGRKRQLPRLLAPHFVSVVEGVLDRLGSRIQYTKKGSSMRFRSRVDIGKRASLTENPEEYRKRQQDSNRRRETGRAE
jgi:hypothetical protein